MRRKGHNFERSVAKQFRQLGFERVKTSRSCSKLLDDCGVDIVGLPFLVQCKSGYPKNRPKFEEESLYIRERLTEKFGPENRVLQHPILLIHELNVGRGKKRDKEHTQVTLSLEDFLQIVNRANYNSTEILDII